MTGAAVRRGIGGPFADPERGSVLAIDKPAGMSSYDIVRRLKPLAGTGRIGHAGTLDVPASGLLVVCIGRATRLVPVFQDWSKRYRTVVRLGVTTDTDDARGAVLAERPVPAADLRARVEAALGDLRGRILQRPPVYSSLKVDGERAYKRALAGETLDLAARPVTVHECAVVSFDPPYVGLEVACSKGTYIRAIARDLGEALGCGASVHELRRLSIGGIHVGDAVPGALLGDGEAALAACAAAARTAEDALAGLPAFAVDDDGARGVRCGRLPDGLPGLDGGPWLRVDDAAGRLLALLRIEDGAWRFAFVLEGA